MSTRIARSLIGVIAAGSSFAQAPAEFELASIRPNTANDRIVTIDVGPGGRFTARGYTLKLLIQRAYLVMGWNISGGPAWIDADRYDISAKAMVAGNLTEAQLRPMLQALLADRFKLRLHESSKEMAGYALVVARGGPKLKASADGEEHADTFRLDASGLRGQGITMQDFSRYVAGKVGAVAVERTGLKGAYDFDIHWTQATDQDTSADPRDAMRQAVFGAVQDQLGLKFAAQRIPIRMLMIDGAEKASAN
jgi:uncharacterized protein (TIGR03435 family)